jgi:hypothetical protein
MNIYLLLSAFISSSTSLLSLKDILCFYLTDKTYYKCSAVQLVALCIRSPPQTVYIPCTELANPTNFLFYGILERKHPGRPRRRQKLKHISWKYIVSMGWN